MHEVAIAQGVIDEIQELSRSGQVSGRVSAVCLRVGLMTAVVHENLRFCFGVLAEGTTLEGARLEIETVPIRAACRACGARFEIQDAWFLCSGCSSTEIEILSGRELEIQAVEVD
jgi:hydrogenase nickel incorporation protein HypA/HybF